MSTVDAFPPPPPPVAPPAGAVLAGAEAAVVALLLLPPHAARPSAASAVAASTAEARLIGSPFLFRSRPSGLTLLRPGRASETVQSPRNSGVSPAKNAVTP